MRRARHVLPGLLIALLPACRLHPERWVPYSHAEPLEPPRAFRDVTVESGHVSRVLALPLVDESSNGPAAAVVTRALIDSLIKLRRFSVVEPDATDAALVPGEGPKRTGRIPVDTIIELGRRYGVDAVLFGTIDRYRPYEPPSLGISATLVDVQTGLILWSATDFVDAADAATATSMRWWFEDQTATGHTVFGPEIMRASPLWFARFAADRLAATLLPEPAQSA